MSRKKTGIFEKILQKLVSEARQKSGKKSKTSFVIIDSQSVKNTDNAKKNAVMRVKNVIIALKEGSKSREKAESVGFKVLNPVEAAKIADIFMILVPDEIHKELWEEVAPHLKSEATLAVAHGFSVHFETIKPSKNTDVIMIAPKGPGHTVRSEFCYIGSSNSFNEY